MSKCTTSLLIVALVAVALTPGWSKSKNRHQESLAQYIERVGGRTVSAEEPAAGSLWHEQSELANLARDYKAHRTGDLVTVLIVQDTTASNTANVTTDRSFSANSGIDALPGRIRTGGIQNLFSPHSSSTLQGKGQATSKSSLRTSLAGRVAAVLPSGALVVEAERSILMNNERQTVVVRGVARPGDIAPDNTVVSNDLSNLELELKGKGVVSEGTRPPNVVVRTVLRILGF